jgi:putative hydrolase of the HAD superfamily
MAASARIRAITFDVGGTLIEPYPSVGHIYAQVAAGNGYPDISPVKLNGRFAAACKARPKFQHSRAAWAELVDEVFCGMTLRKPSRTFFDELYDCFSQPKSWSLFKDVVPTLTALSSQKLKLAVISNWDERLRPLLRRLDLDRWFEVIVVSAEADCAKPDAAIFHRAAERLRLSPNAILHVGDDSDHDVHGAHAAGFNALLLRRSGKRRSRGVITCLDQLSSVCSRPLR